MIKHRHSIIAFALISILFLSCEQEQEDEKLISNLPTIHIDINEKYLWSLDSGLYIVGNNGINGCDGLANYNQKWEFPAHITYFENGEQIFDDRIGFRLKGNCSRTNSQKSMGLYWRKEYGNKKLNHKLFTDIETDEFKRLTLRNSGNDFENTHLKDAAISRIFRHHAKVDYQEYRPSEVFLNKEYWGIYNIREMITPHHFKYHYGVDDEEVDLLTGSEINPQVDDGAKENYIQEVVDFLTSNSLKDEENYLEFGTRIDIESYMDYMIVETYIANTDWPIGNVKWWRDKSSAIHNKWKWVIYDTDFAFDLKELDRIWIGDLYRNNLDKTRVEGFFIFNKLIENKQFRLQFLERYLYFIDVVFEKNRVADIINETKDGISAAYPKHQKKWNTHSKGKWEREVKKLIEFNTKRNDLIRPIIIDLLNE